MSSQPPTRRRRPSLAILLPLLALVVLVIVPAAPAVAAAITVTTTDDELNSDGDCSLREAVESANTNAAVDACPAGDPAPTVDVITFGVTGTITVSSMLSAITEDLTIDGPGAASLTISGGDATPVMQVSSGGTLNLEGVTVADGENGVGPAGIANYGALNVTSSTFSGNGGTGGGGIGNEGSAVLTVSDSIFSGNPGDGIANRFGGTATVSDSTFLGNTGEGGGIQNTEATLTVINSTFSGNSGDRGGGIFNNNASLSVTNSTFSGNSADFGGAIENLIGTATITNSTFSGNSASTGGGIANVFGGGVTTLQNTIVADSPSGGNCAGTITDGGGNLSWPDTTCPGINDDPTLDPAGLQDNGGSTETIALEPGSPAVDAALAANCPATDQRGTARPQGRGCDIGAFELVPIAVTTTDDELNTDGDCSLREAIQAANTDTAVDACSPGDRPDSIYVPAGTYLLGIAGTGEDANATGDLDVLDDVTITGAGQGATIVDGAGLDRVFHFLGGTSQVFDLTVTGGGDAVSSSVCEGAGILNVATATLTLNDVAVSGNNGGEGGGIDNNGTMTLNDSTISGNSAKKRGGGVENAGAAATLTVNNSTISGNSGGGFGSAFDPPCVGLAFFGAGGIFNSDGGALTLNDSTVSGNSAVENGGGIFNHDSAGPLTINRSTVSGNHADDGGGGFINGGTLTLTNSTISGNSDESPGGGIWNYTGTTNVNNGTVNLNASHFGTGGIGVTGGTVTLGGTILANSTSGGDCSGSTITSTGYNLIEDTSGCTITGDTTGNVTGSDPALGPLADNGGPTFTHALLGGSTAMNAGDPACPPPATDQRDVARPQAHRCDIGSFERVAIIAVTLDGTGTILLSGKVQVSGTIACGTPDLWFGNVFLKQRSTSTSGTKRVTGSCTGSSEAWMTQVPPRMGSPGFADGAASLCIAVITRDPSGPPTDRLKICRAVTLSS
jgi:CSLREA domain-containing protein